MAFTVNTSLTYQSYVNVDFPYIEVPGDTVGPVRVTLQSSVTPPTQSMLTTDAYGLAISFWDETGLWTVKGPVADVNHIMGGLEWFPATMSSSFVFTYKCVDGNGATVGTGSVTLNGSASRPTPVIENQISLVTLLANTTDTLDFASVSDPSNGFLTASIQFNRVPGDSQYSANPIVKTGSDASGYAQILTGYYGHSKSVAYSGTLAADPNDPSWFPVWSIYGPAEDVRTALRNLRIKTPSTLKPFQMALKVSNGAGSSPKRTIPADQPSSAYNMSVSFPTPTAVNEDTVIKLTGTLSGNATARQHTVTFTVPASITYVVSTYNAKVTTSWDANTRTFTASGFLADIQSVVTSGFTFTPATDFNGTATVNYMITMEGNSAATINGTVGLVFNPVNDAIKWNSDIDPVFLVEGGASQTRTASAYDPDTSDYITGYVLSGGSNLIGATVNSSGLITFPSVTLFGTDLNNYTTTYTVTASSSDSTTSAKNFNVTYQPKVQLLQTVQI